MSTYRESKFLGRRSPFDELFEDDDAQGAVAGAATLGQESEKIDSSTAISSIEDLAQELRKFAMKEHGNALMTSWGSQFKALAARLDEQLQSLNNTVKQNEALLKTIQRGCIDLKSARKRSM